MRKIQLASLLLRCRLLFNHNCFRFFSCAHCRCGQGVGTVPFPFLVLEARGRRSELWQSAVWAAHESLLAWRSLPALALGGGGRARAIPIFGRFSARLLPVPPLLHDGLSHCRSRSLYFPFQRNKSTGGGHNSLTWTSSSLLFRKSSKVYCRHEQQAKREEE